MWPPPPQCSLLQTEDSVPSSSFNHFPCSSLLLLQNSSSSLYWSFRMMMLPIFTCTKLPLSTSSCRYEYSAHNIVRLKTWCIRAPFLFLKGRTISNHHCQPFSSPSPGHLSTWLPLFFLNGPWRWNDLPFLVWKAESSIIYCKLLFSGISISLLNQFCNFSKNYMAQGPIVPLN